MTTETVTREITEAPEQITRIKPSEALRLGRLSYPVHHPGSFTDGEQGACALGAMAAGWGLTPGAFKQTNGVPALWNNWAGVWDELAKFDVPKISLKRTSVYGDKADAVAFASIIASMFDVAERQGVDGDEAVLQYLAKFDL